MCFNNCFNMRCEDEFRFWLICWSKRDQELHQRSFTSASSYLSRLRRDSIGADFQSVRKLTNYICAKLLESRLSHFYNVCYALQQYPRCGGCGY